MRYIFIAVSTPSPYTSIITREKRCEKNPSFVIAMLDIPHPRDRRYTAEQIFVELDEDGEMLFDKHECQDEANQMSAVSLARRT